MKISFSQNIQTKYHIYPKLLKQHQNQQSLPSFKSDNDTYSNEVINLARKYQYVINPRTYITDEISTYEYMRNGVENVIKYIHELNNKEKIKKEKLANIDAEIKLKDLHTKELEQQDAEMLEKIAKIQIENVIDRIKLQKVLISQKRKQKVCSELKKQYIDLFELDNRIFPNGIMIKGMDDKAEQDFVINFLKSNGCKVLRLDFEKIPLKNAVSEISNCKKNIKNGNQHSVLAVDNFAKYMIYNDENYDFISKMKGLLSSCAKDSNMTFLVFESKPLRLDKNIISGHRFQKVIDVTTYKTDNFCEFMPIHDGLRMVTNDSKEDIVDLYLGNFGYNKKVLWVDSTNPQKIQSVIDRIDKIKKTDKFKNIKYIQCKQPDSLENLVDFYPLKTCSTDFKRIYEKRI